MAEILDNFEFAKGGRRSDYPYDEWFDGRIWKLEERTDFDCKPMSLRSALHAAARKRNLELSTSIVNDSHIFGYQYVIVQAQPKQEKQ